MTKVILVDDHGMFRMGTRMYIESNCDDICVVGEAESGEELLQLAELAVADLIVLDIELPGMNGIEAVRRLKSVRPEIKIVTVSAQTTQETVNAMLDAGVNGFISKRRGSFVAVVEAIREVMSGFEYFGKDISEIIYDIYLSAKKTAKITSEFTRQEREIIELCGKKLKAREIADKLCISHRTVENHKQKIFEKLGINSTKELIQFGATHGIMVSDK